MARPAHSPLTRRAFVCAFAALSAAPLAFAVQVREREQALSDGEVEKLRDTAYYPPERLLAFIGFLDQRAKEIERLSTGPRRPGREEDIHDQLSQFASISDDLDDNLDDYSKRHKDVRKVLPRLVAATERWATILKTPPDHPTYNVERKLAVESLNDVRDSAKEMIDEQKAWFLAHPPAKDDNKPKPPPQS